MGNMTTTLIRAVFGMGNQNHQHVHRHNTLHMDSMAIDNLRLEQEMGGITANTLNTVAQSSGQLTTRPQGNVEIEDGFGNRRGIGMLTFQVDFNATQSTELSVVGYLVGGTYSPEGISTDTLFVPVRCWSTLNQNTHDANGFPMVKRVIDSSHQFLMGDPYQSKDLKATRPLDIANQALGQAIAESDNRGDDFMGTVSSDLKNNLLVSKTQNLNPTHFSRELIKLGTRAVTDTMHGMELESALGNNLMGQGLGEMTPSENPFFHTMMYQLGIHNVTGFQGFSIGEINDVFKNFVDVLQVQLLQVTNFAEDTNLLDSHEYGSATLIETMATEVAMTTVHLLLQRGLMSLSFSASNNPTDFEGISNDAGVAFLVGQAMSVLDTDLNVEGRVEYFKQDFLDNFFAKYSGPYAHQRHIISMTVDCHLFGEISVELFYNGDQSTIRRYVNASYYINHTSSSIAGSDAGLQESKNFLTNIREHF